MPSLSPWTIDENKRVKQQLFRKLKTKDSSDVKQKPLRTNASKQSQKDMPESVGGDEFVSVLVMLPGYLIRRLQQVAVSIFFAHVQNAGHELTPVQYGALLALRHYPNIDQASLAGIIAYDRATIGGVIDRLEKKDLLSRKQSATDKRSRRLAITPNGRKLLAGC